MEKLAGIISTGKSLAKHTGNLKRNTQNLVELSKKTNKSSYQNAKSFALKKNIAKGMALPGMAVAGAGATAALAGDKNKGRRDGVKKIVNENLMPSMKASMGQKVLSGAGALAGTAIQMKRGKSLSDAAKTGGLLGMAAGDIAGSVAIPQGRFIKMHKKEFGTMPSAKDMGKLFAANTVPTAAFWGGVGALKGPRKFYQDNTSMMVNSAIKKKDSAKNALNYAANSGGVPNSEFMPEFLKRVKGPKEKGVGKAMAKMMVVDQVADQVVDAPTKFVTPESLIRKKKEAENMKTASSIVNESFEKVAGMKEVLKGSNVRKAINEVKGGKAVINNFKKNLKYIEPEARKGTKEAIGTMKKDLTKMKGRVAREALKTGGAYAAVPVAAGAAALSGKNKEKTASEIVAEIFNK